MDEKKYLNYTFEELLHDDFFIISHLYPTKETILFWEALQQNNGNLALEMAKALQLLQSLPFRNNQLSSDDKRDLLKQIHRTIRVKKKKSRRRFLTPAIAVAATLAIICMVAWFISKESIHDSLLTAIETTERPTQPISEIQLIDSRNQELIISGDDPEISHNKEGELSINSEKVTGPSTDVREDPATPQYNQLLIPSGKRSFLALSDGSKIWVNANTRVVYPAVFEKEKREIYVEGEIFLEITPDKDRPFIVKTNTMDINVLGTSFNVSAYEDDSYTAVVLVSGKVNVRTKDEQLADLTPNEMLHFENGHIKTAQVNVENYISWRHGAYVFDKVQFSVILNKLSRYYGKKIVWTQEIEKLYCSGTLNLKEDILAQLKRFQSIYPVSFTEKEGIITVNINQKNK